METIKNKNTASASVLDGSTSSVKIVTKKFNNQPLSDSNGGRTSNRPPVIVEPEYINPCQILASGVDTLAISLSVDWKNQNLFKYLSALKEKAQIENNPVEGLLKPYNDTLPWKFDILPHGVRAYTWLLSGKDYFLKIFNSIKPAQRPSVTIEIRSETLWANGPVHSVEYILDVIEGIGADILEVKTSRIDLCVDILLDSKLWTPSLKDYTSTTAKLKSTYNYGFDFTGIVIGKGQISVRLYDKIREINQKSKKFWMYLIWGILIDGLPKNKRIIRVEFQLKREVLKKLIDCDVFITLEYLDQIWAYCTQDWLKFQNNPGEHHSKRNTFDWWKTIQKGFQGIQNSTPFVRTKAIKQDKKQLCAQIYGLLTSLHAITLEEQQAKENTPADLDTIVSNYIDTIIAAKDKRISIPQFVSIDIQKKRARYHNIK